MSIACDNCGKTEPGIGLYHNWLKLENLYTPFTGEKLRKDFCSYDCIKEWLEYIHETNRKYNFFV